MDERMRRLWAGAEAEVIGYGGVLAGSHATGLAPNTVTRGRDELRTYETVVSLIGATTNSGGLVVRARLDRRRYATGKRITEKEMRELRSEPHGFHGDWNYTIRPRVVVK